MLTEKIDRWGMPILLEKKKSPTEGELKDALAWMKANGLAPKGKGKPTKPSFAPPHSLVWDEDENVYFLLLDFGGGRGEMHEIKPNGDTSFVSSFTGEFHPSKGQTVFDDHGNNNYQDRVELEVMRAVLDVVQPGWDDPRPGEPDWQGGPETGSA